MQCVAVVVVVVCFSSLKSTGQRQEQYKGVVDDFLVLFGQIKRSKRKYILRVILYNASFLGLLLFYSATSSGTQYSSLLQETMKNRKRPYRQRTRLPEENFANFFVNVSCFLASTKY